MEKRSLIAAESTRALSQKKKKKRLVKSKLTKGEFCFKVDFEYLSFDLLLSPDP